MDNILQKFNTDNLNAFERLFMLIVLELSNRKGECRLSYTDLISHMGVSKVTVSRVQRSLKEKGIIRIEKKKNEDGGLGTNLIIISDEYI